MNDFPKAIVILVSLVWVVVVSNWHNQITIGFGRALDNPNNLYKIISDWLAKLGTCPQKSQLLQDLQDLQLIS